MCLGSLQACPAVLASLHQCAGPSQCDKRQALEETRQRFPGVDFRWGHLFVFVWENSKCSSDWLASSSEGTHREVGHAKVQSHPIEALRRPLGVCSLIGSDEDTSWEAGHVESESSVVVRGFEFLNWLMQVSLTG